MYALSILLFSQEVSVATLAQSQENADMAAVAPYKGFFLHFVLIRLSRVSCVYIPLLDTLKNTFDEV